MALDRHTWQSLREELESSGVTLVAVSKTQPAEEIQTLYGYGQRDFGENYVQEFVMKRPLLPDDIRWHFIGHLQTNKVKLIVPFVHMVHGVDSLRLLQAIDRHAGLAGRSICCLLQMHIATEETKFGLDAEELEQVLDAIQDGRNLTHARICGLMGMASFTSDMERIREEFRGLRRTFDALKSGRLSHLSDFNTLSMGMSGDFRTAVLEGSTMVRIGSLLFGPRVK